MSHNPRRIDAEQVRRFSDTTIAYYDEFARAFWNGTRDHDVSQNYAAFLGAIKRLDDQARQLERHATGLTVQELIAREGQRSPSYGGRSVYGWEHGQASANIGYNDRR